MRSSWRNGDLDVSAEHPTKPDHELRLTQGELHLLQRIRQLDAGAHAVYVVKDGRGKDGLQSFRVREHYTEGA